MVSESERVEFSVTYHDETDVGYYISMDGDKNNAIWLPKSQTDVLSGTCLPENIIVIDVPQWLACAKSMI